ncbi:putative E3 ubiquitin-protein ligase HERC4 [Acipenser ruthenus]|uniref:Putative E3 ubiquitin-protein ligase HERC4 n=1 Tax=Acipenser ruthenus TaxID=7906 RepID=A0A662YKK6_ACIRT|nr:putative E3 ubiquitin-protein ligase HERC4 [Acipenser ruthenus]
MLCWGNASFGQLGVGGIDEEIVIEPRSCKFFHGKKIRDVGCGRRHTVFVLEDGTVYTCGCNDLGQLGHEKARKKPEHVGALDAQNIVAVSCGEAHTLALNDKGQVFAWGPAADGQLGLPGSQIFSWGQNKIGQLGLGCENKSHCSPQIIRSLLGVPFAQIAAGGAHSFALTLSGAVFGWGRNKFGQLGLNDERDIEEYCCVKRIYAGGDQSFAHYYTPENSLPADDFRNSDFLRKIYTLNYEIIQRWLNHAQGRLPADIANEIDVVFSSASCLNGSFLSDSHPHHHKTSSKFSGVDMNSARLLFHRLIQHDYPNISQQVAASIEKNLLSQLPNSPPDIEALRLYLTLPECPLFSDPNNFTTLAIPFALAIVSLKETPLKVLENWWSKLEPQIFQRIVQLYKEVVVNLLRIRKIGIPPSEQRIFNSFLHIALKILEILHRVNERSAQIIQYDKFYIHELHSLIDIKNDYITWIQQQMYGVDLNQGLEMPDMPVTICTYPFVFDAQAKTTLLQTDAVLQMQVIFVGEEAVDAGGVRKEFFLLIMRELLDPKYGMFRYYEDSRLIWFSDKTFEDIDLFNLIGVICGLAIYNLTIVDLHFPLALYKKLLKKNPTLDDLKELKPGVGRSMQQLLDYPDDNVEDVFCLNFTITVENFGATEVKELIPNGDDVVVNKHNRQDFVNAYVDYVFNTSVAPLFEAFYEGFHKVCGGKVLQLFQPNELQAMVIGNTNYDWKELEKSTEYKGEYWADHPTIKLFWEVFHELPLEEKKQFLLFLSGSDRIPILGMKSLKLVIQPTGGGEQYLPVAHTCFNLLDLPKYTDKQTLRAKLIQAIDHYEGFNLV